MTKYRQRPRPQFPHITDEKGIDDLLIAILQADTDREIKSYYGARHE